MEIFVFQEKSNKKEDILIFEEIFSKKEDIFVLEEIFSKEMRLEVLEKIGNRDILMVNFSVIFVFSRLNLEVKDDINVKNNSIIGSFNIQKVEGNLVVSDNGNVKYGSN